MPNIVIPLNAGLDNYSEPEEVGSNMCTALENVWIDTPGKCTLRPYTNQLTKVEGKVIHKIRRWANPDIEYGGFGWIIVVTDVTYNTEQGFDLDDKTIWIASRDFSKFTYVTKIESKKVPNKIELFEGVAMFTLGKEEDSLRYSHFNSKYFDGVYNYNKWFLDTGRPVNNFIQIKSVTEITSGGTLVKDKYYFYKVVPIFDGLQIGQLPNSYQYQESSVDNSKMEVVFEIDDLNFNPRCTSFDIYRAEGTNELEDLLSYYKIKSISTYAPIVNSGGISDLSQLGMQIADNGTFRDSVTNVPYEKDDYFAILNPTLTGSSGGGDAELIGRDDTETERTWIQGSRNPIFSFKNEIVEEDWFNGGYGIWVGDKTADPVDDDTSIMHSNAYVWDSKKDAMTGNNFYQAGYYSHNDPAVTTDLSTDTLTLRTKIRDSSEWSTGDKDWLLIKKTNLIKNGSGLGNGWEEGMHHNMVAEASKPEANGFHWDTSDYQFNDGGWYDFPCLKFTNNGNWVEENGKIIQGNNGFMQKVSVEVGKTYFFQYAFNWSATASSMGSSYRHYFHAKLTRYAGGWDNSSHDYYSQNSTNGIHYKQYYSGSGYRKTNSGVFTDDLGDLVFKYGGVDPRGWYVYNTTFVAPATEDIYLAFWLDNRGSSYWDYGFNAYNTGFGYSGIGQSLWISDIILAEVDTRSNYYGGNKVILPASFTNYDVDTASVEINTNDYNGGNVLVDDNKLAIVKNTNTLFELSNPIPTSLLGSSPSLFITKSVTTSQTTGTDGRAKMEVTFTDLGYTSLFKHPTMEIPINVKYEFSQYIEGRMFVADCRYTNEQYDEVEQDKNLILFSELNQPNIIPVINYIKVQDNQGGDIVGLSELMGNLVVFMENSIWRINVPSTDPNQWSLVEASSDLGCTSSSSIYSYEDGVFFANKEGLWLMSKTFEPQEISRPWRSHYQENYNALTTVHYCPLSKMLYVNQNNRREVMVLDVNNPQQLNWLKLKDGGSASKIEGWSSFFNDETQKPFFYENRDGDTYVGELESRTGNFKMNFVRRTGWIRLGDLKERKMIRRINIRYKNNFDGDGVAPDLYIWVDGKGFAEDDIFYQKSGDDLFLDKTGKESIASLRCGVRCKYFAIEIGKSFAETPDKISEGQDIFELLSLEVEWEQ